MPLPLDEKARMQVQISAKNGVGIEEMLSRLETLLKYLRRCTTAMLPYTEGRLLGWVHGRCEIIREEHTAEGILLEAYVDEEAENRLAPFAVQAETH